MEAYVHVMLTDNGVSIKSTEEQWDDALVTYVCESLNEARVLVQYLRARRRNATNMGKVWQEASMWKRIRMPQQQNVTQSLTLK